MRRSLSWQGRLIPLALFLNVAALMAADSFAAPPANTVKPSVSGTAREGQTLSASNGTWQNAPTSFRYQWQRCDAGGSGCLNLASQTQQTYTLDADDVGRTVRVVVVAVNADGNGSAASDATAVVSSSSAPRNTSKPTIAGTAKVGEELTAERGTWAGAPDRFAFQWERCDGDGAGCAEIAGATGQAYGVRTADIGRRLRVTAKATNGVGTTSAASDTTAVVSGPVAAPPRARNERPSLVVLSVRVLGPRVYARFRVCDDSRRNVTIVQHDRRAGIRPYVRRFTTLRPPLPCAAYTRSWRPAPRFRDGSRFVITLQARDTSGRASSLVRRAVRMRA